MSAPPQKRQRADTAGAYDHILTPTLETINSFPPATIANLLYAAAAVHNDVASSVIREALVLSDARAAKKIDFDHYSKSAWRELNISYKGLSGSKEYNMAGNVQNSLSEIIDSITKKLYSNSSFETKESALSTLRKIGKSVFLCDLPYIRKEVRNSSILGELEDGMLKAMECMSADERGRVIEEEELVEKIEELKGLSDGEMEGLDGVLTLLQVNPSEDGTGGHDDSSPDDTDDDEEEGDEDDDEEELDEEEVLEDFDSDGCPKSWSKKRSFYGRG